MARLMVRLQSGGLWIRRIDPVAAPTQQERIVSPKPRRANFFTFPPRFPEPLQIHQWSPRWRTGGAAPPLLDPAGRYTHASPGVCDACAADGAVREQWVDLLLARGASRGCSPGITSPGPPRTQGPPAREPLGIAYPSSTKGIPPGIRPAPEPRGDRPAHGGGAAGQGGGGGAAHAPNGSDDRGHDPRVEP